MAYVRKHGNQLAIVHGEREQGTGKVMQSVLFRICSKPEALAILGRGPEGAALRFKSLLEGHYPGISFPWKTINRSIQDNVEALPDMYDYPLMRIQGTFREDLCAFTRQIGHADPQALASAAKAIRQHRHELEFIVDLVNFRLKCCDAKESAWNADNEFCWRFALGGGDVPMDAEEMAEGLYNRGKLDRAEAAFRLLIDAFQDYAEGHNYLGLIALQRRKLDEAIGHFEKTVEVGRRLFPKRIARKSYWSDLSTRPYIRGLRNLALTLQQAGRYDEAMSVCHRLESECGKDADVQSDRAAIHLNTGRWAEAAKEAGGLRDVMPSEGFVAALALFELGSHAEATSMFLHAALNYPRAAKILVGQRTSEPREHQEAEDHNLGVHLVQVLDGYLTEYGTRSCEFFGRILKERSVVALHAELAEADLKWRSDRTGADHTPFERMHEMKSAEFAKAEAAKLAGSSTMLIDRGGSHGRNGKVKK